VRRDAAVGDVEIGPVAWADVADLRPGDEGECDYFFGSGVWAVGVGHLVSDSRELDLDL
jgi:hypothetical protein